MNHATFKASLFMAAGIIDHETGTRDMRRLSGVFRHMPFTATLAMVASASMAGVPLLNGFLSKEMFFAEAIETHKDNILDTVTPYVATLASMFAVTYSLRFIHSVFFGPPPHDLPKMPHEPPHWMRAPIEFLVLACLVVGIIPTLTIGPFLHTAVRSVLGDATPVYSLAVWHGWTVPLLMSLIALGGGVGAFPHDEVLPRDQRRGPALLPPSAGPAHLRTRARHPVVEMGALDRNAGGHAPAPAADAHPRCRGVCSLAQFRCWMQGFKPAPILLQSIDPAFALIWLIGMVCAVGAAYQAKFHRLAALVLLGGAGSRHLPHLRLAFGARSRRDAAPRRNRHHRAHPARPALAAEAHRETGRCRK